jgi:hypothetical protein
MSYDYSLEYWDEIKARHKREKIQLLQSLCNTYTTDEAAKILKMNTATLRAFGMNNGIKFLKKAYCKKEKRYLCYMDNT